MCCSRECSTCISFLHPQRVHTVIRVRTELGSVDVKAFIVYLYLFSCCTCALMCVFLVSSRGESKKGEKLLKRGKLLIRGIKVRIIASGYLYFEANKLIN